VARPELLYEPASFPEVPEYGPQVKIISLLIGEHVTTTASLADGAW
jgi:hypothetical protein